jgi:carboxyl-terminal processing protease
LRKEQVLLWIASFFLLGIWIGIEFMPKGKDSSSSLSQFFSYLETEYVDTLDIEQLQAEAMDFILSTLDPHSAYIPADETQSMAERMQGNFSGIGVEFTLHKDTLVFTHVMEGGPAQKHGLLAGDRVLTIDGDSVYGPELTTELVTSKIKGPEGSGVEFELFRDGSLVNKSVVRGQIPLESVFGTRSYGALGYVRIDRFAETTHEELLEALKELDARGMRALLLDLRDNPGGYLHEAVEIADEFLSKGKTIVSTEYKNGETVISESTAGQKYEDLPIVVLINGQSASASEVLTGALQDHDRALVIGSRSFGKGLVQEDKILTNGSRVRLTVAYYFTPSGRSIQNPYEGADLTKMMEGRSFESDSGKFLDATGGINPDVFIEKDSTDAVLWSLSLGTIDAFAFEWVDKQRSQLLRKWDLEKYALEFVVDEELMGQFLSFGAYGITSDDLARSETQMLKQSIKVTLAKHIWGFDGYRRVLQDEDEVLQRAVDIARTTLK